MSSLKFNNYIFFIFNFKLLVKALNFLIKRCPKCSASKKKVGGVSKFNSEFKEIFFFLLVKSINKIIKSKKKLINITQIFCLILI